MEHPTPELDAAMRERDWLLGVCYRLLGSLAEAEDAVQETYLRWFRLEEAERVALASPRAWLTRVASRVCLDVLGSARARRERYVGPWLPEPLPGELPRSLVTGATDPQRELALAESLSMAAMVLLDTLTAAQRVSFVLHDVLDYPFSEVAELVGRSPAACRQLALEARRRLDASRPSLRASTDAHTRAVREFKEAWRAADVARLVAALDPSARAIIDGGGRVSASLTPLEGALVIAAFFTAVLEREPRLGVLDARVNGQPGLVAAADGALRAVVSFAVDARGRIVRVWAVRNPDKLRCWPAQA